MVIKFIYEDGSHKVLKPSVAFINHVEVETDYNKFVKGKHPQRVLTLEERVAKMAYDDKAVNFIIN